MDIYDLQELIDNIDADNITHVFIEWEKDIAENNYIESYKKKTLCFST